MTTNEHKHVPRHIGIVMDGNGRWAKARHRPRSFGHNAGRKAVREVVEGCLRQGVEALTLFAFSSENWQRPQDEVGALMDLFVRALDKEVDELHGNGVRLRFIGELDAFEEPLRQRMLAAMKRTAGNDKLQMNVAVNYGGRWDIVQAARKAAVAVARGELPVEAIDEAMFDQLDVPGRRSAAGSFHSHRRRPPRQQLPAVADGLCGAVFHRYAVARLQPGLADSMPLMTLPAANAALAAPAIRSPKPDR